MQHLPILKICSCPCQAGPNAAQAFLVGICKVVVQILAGGQQVKGRVDAEQQHLHLPAEGSQFGHLGIVGTHANVADHTLFLLLLHIGQKLPVHHLAELRLTVHKVNHSQVDVVRLQASE